MYTLDTDPALGSNISKHLKKLHIETPMILRSQAHEIHTLFFNIMHCLGLDVADDSLCSTPNRVQKMYEDEIFYGLDYNKFPKCTTVHNKMRYDEVISCRCTVYSVCEHHFIPFIGNAYVAYIPQDRILGLSKFNRIVDFFSRRPQIQERLTEQISATLRFILSTEDVAVVVRAEHLCVKMRGIRDQQSDTTTSSMKGRFFTNHSLRAEFLSLAHNNH